MVARVPPNLAVFGGAMKGAQVATAKIAQGVGKWGRFATANRKQVELALGAQFYTVGEAVFEGALTFSEIIQEGGTPNEAANAAALNTALNMVVLSGTNLVSFGPSLIRKAASGGGSVDQTASRVLRWSRAAAPAAGRVARVGIMEGVQEVGQEYAGAFAAGHPPDYLAEAFLLGAMGGSGMAIGLNTFEMFGQPSRPEEAQAAYDRLARQENQDVLRDVSLHRNPPPDNVPRLVDMLAILSTKLHGAENWSWIEQTAQTLREGPPIDKDGNPRVAAPEVAVWKEGDAPITRAVADQIRIIQQVFEAAQELNTRMGEATPAGEQVEGQPLTAGSEIREHINALINQPYSEPSKSDIADMEARNKASKDAEQKRKDDVQKVQERYDSWLDKAEGENVPRDVMEEVLATGLGLGIGPRDEEGFEEFRKRVDDLNTPWKAMEEQAAAEDAYGEHRMQEFMGAVASDPTGRVAGKEGASQIPNVLERAWNTIVRMSSPFPGWKEAYERGYGEGQPLTASGIVQQLKGVSQFYAARGMRDKTTPRQGEALDDFATRLLTFDQMQRQAYGWQIPREAFRQQPLSGIAALSDSSPFRPLVVGIAEGEIDTIEALKDSIKQPPPPTLKKGEVERPRISPSQFQQGVMRQLAGVFGLVPANSSDPANQYGNEKYIEPSEIEKLLDRLISTKRELDARYMERSGIRSYKAPFRTPLSRARLFDMIGLLGLQEHEYIRPFLEPVDSRKDATSLRKDVSKKDLRSIENTLLFESQNLLGRASDAVSDILHRSSVLARLASREKDSVYDTVLEDYPEFASLLEDPPTAAEAVATEVEAIEGYTPILEHAQHEDTLTEAKSFAFIKSLVPHLEIQDRSSEVIQRIEEAFAKLLRQEEARPRGKRPTAPEAPAQAEPEVAEAPSEAEAEELLDGLEPGGRYESVFEPGSLLNQSVVLVLHADMGYDDKTKTIKSWGVQSRALAQALEAYRNEVDMTEWTDSVDENDSPTKRREKFAQVLIRHGRSADKSARALPLIRRAIQEVEAVSEAVWEATYSDPSIQMSGFPWSGRVPSSAVESITYEALDRPPGMEAFSDLSKLGTVSKSYTPTLEDAKEWQRELYARHGIYRQDLSDVEFSEDNYILMLLDLPPLSPVGAMTDVERTITEVRDAYKELLDREARRQLAGDMPDESPEVERAQRGGYFGSHWKDPSDPAWNRFAWQADMLEELDLSRTKDVRSNPFREHVRVKHPATGSRKKGWEKSLEGDAPPPYPQGLAPYIVDGVPTTDSPRGRGRAMYELPVGRGDGWTQAGSPEMGPGARQRAIEFLGDELMAYEVAGPGAKTLKSPNKHERFKQFIRMEAAAVMRAHAGLRALDELPDDISAEPDDSARLQRAEETETPPVVNEAIEGLAQAVSGMSLTAEDRDQLRLSIENPTAPVMSLDALAQQESPGDPIVDFMEKEGAVHRYIGEVLRRFSRNSTSPLHRGERSHDSPGPGNYRKLFRDQNSLVLITNPSPEIMKNPRWKSVLTGDEAPSGFDRLALRRVHEVAPNVYIASAAHLPAPSQQLQERYKETLRSWIAQEKRRADRGMGDPTAPILEHRDAHTIIQDLSTLDADATWVMTGPIESHMEDGVSALEVNKQLQGSMHDIMSEMTDDGANLLAEGFPRWEHPDARMPQAERDALGIITTVPHHAWFEAMVKSGHLQFIDLVSLERGDGPVEMVSNPASELFLPMYAVFENIADEYVDLPAQDFYRKLHAPYDPFEPKQLAREPQAAVRMAKPHGIDPATQGLVRREQWKKKTNVKLRRFVSQHKEEALQEISRLLKEMMSTAGSLNASPELIARLAQFGAAYMAEGAIEKGEWLKAVTSGLLEKKPGRAKAGKRRKPVETKRSKQLRAILKDNEDELFELSQKELYAIHGMAWQDHATIAPAFLVGDDQSLLVSTRVPGSTTTGASGLLLDSTLQGILESAKTAEDRKALYGKAGLLGRWAKSLRGSSLLTEEQSRSRDPKKIIEAALSAMKSNIRFIYDSIDPATRGRSILWYEGANRIARQIAQDNNISVNQAIGVIAVLSPQTFWDANVARAQRVVEQFVRLQAENTVFSKALVDDYLSIAGVNIDETHQKAIERAKGLRTKASRETAIAQANLVRKHQRGYADSIRTRLQGRRWNSLNLADRAVMLRVVAQSSYPKAYEAYAPEGFPTGELVKSASGRAMGLSWGPFNQLVNAIAILTDGTPVSISEHLGVGHKVRSFYNNMSVPGNPLSVTIDSQAVGAAYLQAYGPNHPRIKETVNGPSDTALGIKSLNPVVAEAYAQVANELGLLPRQLQSIVWEGARALFPSEDKVRIGSSQN